MTNEDLQQIQNLVTGARRVLILTHANPPVDTMASALALYLALRKMGKDVTVAMDSNPLVELGNLVGVQDVKTSLSGKNLLVTYKPYNLGDFEKVTYLEDQGQAGSLDDSFKLTITPREGFTPDPKNFIFSSTGTAADLIFTVEVLEPTQLGKLYDAGLFAATPIINIDNHDPNKDYGKFNLVEPEAASVSEIVTFFLRAVNAQLDADIANNLYQGIQAATNNFQSPKVAAATFEAAAICLRSKPARAASTPATPGGGPQPVSPMASRGEPVQPFADAQGKPVQPAGQSPLGGAQPQPTNTNPVPAYWTQPKSYRGTSIN